MRTPNSLTTLASANGKRPSMSTPGRPKFVAWTLRLVLCSTDSRTDSGDLQRIIKRAADELTPEERAAAYETANNMLAALRQGAELVEEIRLANEAVDAEIAEKVAAMDWRGKL